MSPTFDVELSVRAEGPPRRGEPVTCGIPWPRGALADASGLRLCDAAGRLIPLQARVLNRWPGGSARWVLLDWQATADGTVTYRVSNQPGAPAPGGPAVEARADWAGIRVSTGAAE